MKPVPWRHVNSWNCFACGLCCKGYDVVLKYPEWLRIIQLYGVAVTRSDVSRLYLGKSANGSCIFRYNFLDRSICGLQNMKPRACKLWPFKVYSQPRYGKQNHASYEYRDRELFVYVDPGCPGLRFGRNPSRTLTFKVMPEFVEIALELREKQFYSTSRVPSTHLRFRGRKVI